MMKQKRNYREGMIMKKMRRREEKAIVEIRRTVIAIHAAAVAAGKVNEYCDTMIQIYSESK